MNAIKCGLIFSLLLSCAAQAETMKNHPSDDAAQQSYHAGMSKMHEDMMAGMKESNSDVAFAKGMIAHHQGAIDMAQTELKYGKDPEMRKLAEAIIKAQQPEIDQMQNWLKQQKR
ncbi:CopM family metallochaperone [Erwinia oleae]|uniref:CopM family metallochaperone n=1 Tax=Erwinia oleae TaxID=796334 RepID=UPI000552591B